MYLDQRLRSVVDEIEGSRVMIDVGTDHGKVILTALSEGRCEKGIASDISYDSLAKARELAGRMGIPLDTRCGDGLMVLTDADEVDTCVIAGMGGMEIVKILSSYRGQIERLILVPHRDARLVRCYISEHGYSIDKDYMVSEGDHYYPIIVASIGHRLLTKREQYYGYNDMTNTSFRAYISHRLEVLESIASRTDKADIDDELTIARDIVREVER